METDLFYACPKDKCNKKYKTWSKFNDHLKLKHNKRKINKDSYVQIRMPALVKKKREIKPKEVEKPKEDPVLVLPCCVCADAEANHAVVPCGHMSFCGDCITTYHRENPTKGCPLCNQDIIMITRIYSGQ